MAFHFQQFSIHQDRCAMKVGTDGVLLGAWAKPVSTTASMANPPIRILDIGTGTGILALMLAQRFPKAKIQSIELEKNAYEQAKQNIQQSKWANRIQIQHCSLQQFVQDQCQRQQYDLIVSNPPYFHNAHKAKTTARTQARHTTTLPPSVLLAGIAQLRHPKGTVCLILPSNLYRYIKQKAALYQLFLHRIVQVRDQQDAPIKRLLLQWHSSFIYPVPQQVLTLKDNTQQRSSTFNTLVQDFYW